MKYTIPSLALMIILALFTPSYAQISDVEATDTINAGRLKINSNFDYLDGLWAAAPGWIRDSLNVYRTLGLLDTTNLADDQWEYYIRWHQRNEIYYLNDLSHLPYDAYYPKDLIWRSQTSRQWDMVKWVDFTDTLAADTHFVRLVADSLTARVLWDAKDSLAFNHFFRWGDGNLYHVRQAGLDSLGEFARRYIGRGLYLNAQDTIRVDLQTNSGLSLLESGVGMGTPSTLTASTTNAVTSSSHTHAVTGFLTAEVDGSVTNEIQTLSLVGTTLSISGTGGNSVYFTNWDTNNADGGDYDWSVVNTRTLYAGTTTVKNASGDQYVRYDSPGVNDEVYLYLRPNSVDNERGVLVKYGADHTYANAAEFRNYVGGNTKGYVRLLQSSLVQIGDSLYVTNQARVGTGLITETKIGYWNTAYGWGNHASAGYLTAEVDGSTSNEIEVVDEAYSSANFNGGTTSAVSQDDFYDYNHIADTDDDGKPQVVDLASAGFVKTDVSGNLSVDTNTYLTAEVDGSVTNEIQTLSLVGTTLSISGTGGNSVYFTNWDTNNADGGDYDWSVVNTRTLYAGTTTVKNASGDQYVRYDSPGVNDEVYLYLRPNSVDNERGVVVKYGADHTYANAAELRNYVGGNIKGYVRLLQTSLVQIGDSLYVPNQARVGAGLINATKIGYWNTAYGWGNHASAGYLTAEVDGSTSNEIEVVDEAYSSANFNGGTTSGVSQDDFYDYNHIADTDDDGKPQVVDLSSAGFVKTDASGNLSVDTNTYLAAEVDGSVTNEIQTLSLVGTTLSISGTGGNSVYFTGWDTNASDDGDITGVTAGTGLSGGGTSGSVTLSLATDWANSSQSAANYAGSYTVPSSGTFSGSTLRRLIDNGALYFQGGSAWDKGGFAEIYSMDHGTRPGWVTFGYGAHGKDLSSTFFTLKRYDNGGDIDVLRADINGDITLYDAMTTTGVISAGSIGTGTTWNGNQVDFSSYVNATVSYPLQESGDNIQLNYDAADFTLMYSSTLALKDAGIDTNEFNDTEVYKYISDHSTWITGWNIASAKIRNFAGSYYASEDVVNSSGVYIFDDEAVYDDRLYYQITVPGDYDENGDPYIAVLWEGQDATAGDVRWQLGRQWADVGEVFPADSTLYVNDQNIETGTKYLNIAYFARLNGAGYKVNGVIKGMLARNSSNANDTYNSKDAYLHDIVLVYPIDRAAGMREYNAK